MSHEMAVNERLTNRIKSKGKQQNTIDANTETRKGHRTKEIILGFYWVFGFPHHLFCNQNSDLLLILQFQATESMSQVLRRFVGLRVKSVMIPLVQSLPDLPGQLVLVAEEVPAQQYHFHPFSSCLSDLMVE